LEDEDIWLIVPHGRSYGADSSSDWAGNGLALTHIQVPASGANRNPIVH